MIRIKLLGGIAIVALLSAAAVAQEARVTIKKSDQQKKVDVLIGGKLFTTFIYADTLEKPVLYPLTTAGGTIVTRGFPLNPKPDDPTDHPHHIGLWFNFENLNGLDFWNNSYAIAADKKAQYGWIRTDKITEIKEGTIGVLAYHANWTNQAKEVILEENTRFEFSGNGSQRVIDRVTTLSAAKEAVFTDAKDGMLGLRLAHELQMPTTKDEKFTDGKGIVTLVKGGTDKVPTGNYRSSEGKTGDAVWSSRGVWCQVYGKMGADSVGIAIIDHPKNPNYPTFWHARGYGLFAANPLGEKVFTNGASAKNLTLKKGESVTFRYRVVISNGKTPLSPVQLNTMAGSFAKK
ncbi:Methane oxygenase PmoA [Pedobacter westerhofensis]|uniref:Methane oxygenase PmoA n=1 Tax=Pedobacter westerhofensis TaxID=425512 RepID=A0A521BYP4_9SPHI|nr:PmoA family protein [Pedobacter westerhofensis]SMO52296.1 Methane oxygenase PmoA [Pedobacter westerhofensis]